MLSVLVLGVGGNVSQGILKALRHGSLQPRTVGACIDPLSMGLYECDQALISPRADDPAFIPWLFETCAEYDVDAVLSGVEPVLEALAPHAGQLREQAGSVCVVSPPEVLAVGRDKLRTAQWLEERGLPFAPSADAGDGEALDALLARCGFPLIAKPRDGRSGEGVVVLSHEHDLDGVRGRAGVVVQQLLGDAGSEYTVGCLSDAEGRLRGSIAMQRRLLDGTTVSARVGDFPAVSEVAEQVVAALRPVGPCNVQLRTHHGVPTPFELNIRFSGTTPMRAHFGWDDVEACLRELVLGERPSPLARVTSGLALRYWNEVYVDPQAPGELSRTGRLDRPREHVAGRENWGVS